MTLSGLFKELLSPLTTLRRIKRTDSAAAEMHSTQADQLFLCGQIAARQLPENVTSIQDAEFRVFSQYGEDGIIQYLIRKLAGRVDKSFVEFGVQDYMESNTRFLLMNNGWRGLVLDGDAQYIKYISARGFDANYGLRARCAMVSRDNINDLLREEGFGSDLGLLSIDVDSVDWHLWNALTIVKPAIVIVEYNQCFPIDRPITIPYETDFDRTKKHYTNWYFGTSLPALTTLAAEKGYKFVGVESHNCNAFFVRDDLASIVPNDILKKEYVTRNTDKVMEVLKGMPVFNAATKLDETI